MSSLLTFLFSLAGEGTVLKNVSNLPWVEPDLLLASLVAPFLIRSSLCVYKRKNVGGGGGGEIII